MLRAALTFSRIPPKTSTNSSSGGRQEEQLNRNGLYQRSHLGISIYVQTTGYIGLVVLETGSRIGGRRGKTYHLTYHLCPRRLDLVSTLLRLAACLFSFSFANSTSDVLQLLIAIRIYSCVRWYFQHIGPKEGVWIYSLGSDDLEINWEQ